MNRRELEQRSVAFAVQVFGLCRTLRQRPGGRQPAEQLQRAASSAAANYRASGRSRSHKEFSARLGVVNEEADEAVFWLEFIRRTGLSPAAEADTLLAEAFELRAIFAASYATSRRRRDDRGR